ncbi:MAG: T9SS type A sorting domain-containing protein [Flavobacteriales bacterium]|nr:T9SS type A sorting domain-containing protein [Flavobacteriales bacterium]
MRDLITIALLAVFGHVYPQSGPGGVGSSSSNVLWLDANSGVSHLLGAVNTWSDRSGNANHAYLPVTIPLGTPTLVTNSVNGNRSLDFDGFDDQLWIPHHASLSLTQWHFFLVVTADLQKDYNAWMVKGDDGSENYEMLSYSDGNIHAPVLWNTGVRDFPSSAGGQVTTSAFDIIEYSYSAAVGRDVYKNGTTIITDNENRTPQLNSLPLYIANERGTTGRNVNGDVAEVIAYNTPLNGTHRLVLNNYLAAKYGRTLSSNDIYVQDNTGQGNFDYDVAGIGRISSSNLHNDARGSGIVRINNPTGLGDNEFMLWGSDRGVLGTFGVTGLPAGVQGRWQRTWRVNEVNVSGTAVDVGAVDMTWDLSGFASVNASHLRLLVDANNNNNFADDTPISGAVALGSGSFRFSGVTALANDVRFTLGTTNIGQTPLPVELLSFTATPGSGRNVLLEWETASEWNNEHFAVQRSGDATAWMDVARIEAVGNSTVSTHYESIDPNAEAGMNYYRLRQTDLDGSVTYSSTVPVRLDGRGTGLLTIVPNPSTGNMVIHLDQPSSCPLIVSMTDGAGRIVVQRRFTDSETPFIPFDPGAVPAGTYTVLLEDGQGSRRGRVVIAH